MEVEYHALARRDLVEILRYYHDISPRLADEFEDDFRAIVSAAAKAPLKFAPAGSFRRANLQRFPYHVLYHLRGNSLRIMVLRHNKRHPDFGTGRT